MLLQRRFDASCMHHFQVENKVFAFYFNYNGPRVRKQAVAQACKLPNAHGKNY